MTYSHFIHRHKFAVWCAARAVQRKFAKTIFLRDALEKCGIVEFMEHYNGGDISPETFDKLHEKLKSHINSLWKCGRKCSFNAACTFLGLDRNFHENQTYINKA